VLFCTITGKVWLFCFFLFSLGRKIGLLGSRDDA